MKTPREILLAQHRAAEPKLDAIRRSVVAEELNRQATKKQSLGLDLVAWFLRCSNTFWRELFFPSRRIWTGLAAIWILLCLVNFSQRDPVSSVTGKPVHSPAVMMSWQVQQRWMNELFADRAAGPEADRPKNVPPKPRSQISETAFV
jgi:hypothetical protein